MTEDKINSSFTSSMISYSSFRECRPVFSSSFSPSSLSSHYTESLFAYEASLPENISLLKHRAEGHRFLEFEGKDVFISFHCELKAGTNPTYRRQHGYQKKPNIVTVWREGGEAENRGRGETVHWVELTLLLHGLQGKGGAWEKPDGVCFIELLPDRRNRDGSWEGEGVIRIRANFPIECMRYRYCNSTSGEGAGCGNYKSSSGDRMLEFALRSFLSISPPPPPPPQQQLLSSGITSRNNNRKNDNIQKEMMVTTGAKEKALSPQLLARTHTNSSYLSSLHDQSPSTIMPSESYSKTSMYPSQWLLLREQQQHNHQPMAAAAPQALSLPKGCNSDSTEMKRNRQQAIAAMEQKNKAMMWADTTYRSSSVYLRMGWGGREEINLDTRGGTMCFLSY
eukprot:jgi/Bigna1/140279/aug1.55_g14987